MLIACGAGILVGAVVGGIAVLRNLMLPVFSSLYAVPIVILYPIFTAWFGIGSESKIAFAGLYGFFPVMLSTAAGIRTIDPQYLLAARSMGATIPQQITRVIIPASIPTVLTGLRLGGALTIIGVVVSEMLTASAGIGYLVTRYRTILDSAHVFAGDPDDPAAVDPVRPLGALGRAAHAGLADCRTARPLDGHRHHHHVAGARAGLILPIPGSVTMAEALLQTTVVGSYPQPDWLVDRALLMKGVPRTRLHELWRVQDPYLQQAQDDATLLAIRDMERAGIDIITDGEMRRESYSNHFATALEGVDNENPAEIINNRGQKTLVPRVVGKIRRTRPVEVRDMQFLRANTGKAAKITLPGPFTMGQQVHDEFYKDAEAMCMDYAAAVNEEAHELVKAGADVIQLDEPWLRNNPDEAKRYAVKVINRALEGITVPTVVHLCFGYAAVVHRPSKPTGYSFLPQLSDTIAQQISIESAQPKIDLGVLKDLAPKKVMLGVIDLSDPEIETPQKVAERIRAGLKYLSPDKLLPAPDCGMKYLPRATAFGKLKAMAEGAAIVRQENCRRRDLPSEASPPTSHGRGKPPMPMA